MTVASVSSVDQLISKILQFYAALPSIISWQPSNNLVILLTFNSLAGLVPTWGHYGPSSLPGELVYDIIQLHDWYVVGKFCVC